MSRKAPAVPTEKEMRTALATTWFPHSPESKDFIRRALGGDTEALAEVRWCHRQLMRRLRADPDWTPPRRHPTQWTRGQSRPGGLAGLFFDASAAAAAMEQSKTEEKST